MMSYSTESKDKTRKYGEVFTPAGVVFEMILHNDLRDGFVNVDQKIFDPAVGEGQFPCAELVLKMFCNVDHLDEFVALRALNSLFGMDIQPANVEKAHQHLLATLIDAYKFFTGDDFSYIDDAKKIIEHNITVGDSLKFMQRKAAIQPSLFED